MRGREPNTISFSTEALLANLLRLKNEWEAVQASRNRDAIYQYLSAVFETIVCWAKEGKAVNRAQRALHLRGHKSVREPATEMDNHKTPAHFDPRRDDHLPPKSKNETCKHAWGTTALRKGEQKMLKDMMTTKGERQ
jgi:hypothetical protein